MISQLLFCYRFFTKRKKNHLVLESFFGLKRVQLKLEKLVTSPEVPCFVLKHLFLLKKTNWKKLLLVRRLGPPSHQWTCTRHVSVYWFVCLFRFIFLHVHFNVTKIQSKTNTCTQKCASFRKRKRSAIWRNQTSGKDALKMMAPTKKRPHCVYG